jgi:hypothetical protein
VYGNPTLFYRRYREIHVHTRSIERHFRTMRIATGRLSLFPANERSNVDIEILNYVNRETWFRVYYSPLFVLASQICAQKLPTSLGAVAAPAPVIHTTVDEVALDLVVRDKKGRLVTNLVTSDVEIYEDAVRQQTRSLRLVTGGDGPAQPPGLAERAGAERPAPAGAE